MPKSPSGWKKKALEAFQIDAEADTSGITQITWRGPEDARYAVVTTRAHAQGHANGVVGDYVVVDAKTGYRIVPEAEWESDHEADA